MTQKDISLTKTNQTFSVLDILPLLSSVVPTSQGVALSPSHQKLNTHTLSLSLSHTHTHTYTISHLLPHTFYFFSFIYLIAFDIFFVPNRLLCLFIGLYL